MFIFKCAYTNPADYFIEADASSSTYPLAMAALTGGKVTIHGVGQGSLQGFLFLFLFFLHL